MRLAVSEIFHRQTTNHRLTMPKTEAAAVHCRSLREVIITKNLLNTLIAVTQILRDTLKSHV